MTKTPLKHEQISEVSEDQHHPKKHNLGSSTEHLGQLPEARITYPNPPLHNHPIPIKVKGENQKEKSAHPIIEFRGATVTEDIRNDKVIVTTQNGVSLGTTVVSETSYGQSPVAGTGSRAAHEDHTHGTPASTAINPATTVIPETSYGQSPDVGKDITYAREDHTHGTPNASQEIVDWNYYNQVGVQSWEHWYLLGAAVGITPTSGHFFGKNVLYSFPFIAPRGGTIDYVGVICDGGVAQSNIRLGFYQATSPTNFYPDALLLDAGTISTNSFGVKKLACSLTFPYNQVIWFTMLSDSDNVTMRVLSCIYTYPILGYKNDLSSGDATRITAVYAYGALPVTHPGGTLVVYGDSVTATWVRYSA